MQDQEFRHQILLFVAGIAFTAWAGVVAWMGNSIIGQLEQIHADVKEMNQEFHEYKLQDTEERSRLKTQVEAILKDHDELKATPR